VRRIVAGALTIFAMIALGACGATTPQSSGSPESPTSTPAGSTSPQTTTAPAATSARVTDGEGYIWAVTAKAVTKVPSYTDQEADGSNLSPPGQDFLAAPVTVTNESGRPAPLGDLSFFMAVPPADAAAFGSGLLCGPAIPGSACEITGGGTLVDATGNEVGSPESALSSTVGAGQSVTFTVYAGAVPQAAPVSDVELCMVTSQIFVPTGPTVASVRIPLGS